MTSRSPVRRSSDAQLAAMRRQWPDFTGEKQGNGTLVWWGPLRPKARLYTIMMFWHPVEMSLPYVMVRDPAIKPREGGSFAGIPHLIFDKDKPEDSGLCLFDPDGHEWSPGSLIAETTVWWAAEWLTYYELWRMTGTWLAPGVGYESAARMAEAEAAAIRASRPNVH